MNHLGEIELTKSLRCPWHGCRHRHAEAQLACDEHRKELPDSMIHEACALVGAGLVGSSPWRFLVSRVHLHLTQARESARLKLIARP